MQKLIRLIAVLELLASCSGRTAKPTIPKPVCRGGLISEEVSFAAGDGLRVSGTYLNPCAETAVPVVVLVHGLCQERGEWVQKPHDWVSPLAAQSVATLAIDLRGHGQSKRWPNGTIHDLCVQSRDLLVESKYRDVAVGALYDEMVLDVRAAIAFALHEKKAPSVALVGTSMGANAALAAFAVDTRVVAVVALSPSLDNRGIRTVPSVSNAGNRPIWLEGAEDDPGAAETLRELARANPAVRTVIWPTGGHGNAIVGARPDEFAALIDFIVSSLRQTQPIADTGTDR